MNEESQEMVLIAKLVKTLTEHLKIISKQSQSIRQLQEMVEAQGAAQLIFFNLLVKNDERQQAYFYQEIEKIISGTDLEANPYLREMLQEYLKISQKQLEKSLYENGDTRPPWFHGVIHGNRLNDNGHE